MKVDGSVVVITGGASGLGKGVAQTLVAKGARVVILDLPQSEGKDISDSLGNSTIFYPCDVTDSEQVKTVVDDIYQTQSRIDVLVSCAGISIGQRMISREGEIHSLEHFRRHVEVNLVGLFDVVRHATFAMSRNEPSEEGEKGLVVNIASIAGMEGQIGQVSYGASKAGVIGLTLPLARDLARDGIRVMTVCPGTMDTPMLATLNEEQIASIVAGNIFPQRLGTPADLAELVTHLMENTFLNGEVIRFDAGLRLGPR